MVFLLFVERTSVSVSSFRTHQQRYTSLDSAPFVLANGARGLVATERVSENLDDGGIFRATTPVGIRRGVVCARHHVVNQGPQSIGAFMLHAFGDEESSGNTALNRVVGTNAEGEHEVLSNAFVEPAQQVPLVVPAPVERVQLRGLCEDGVDCLVDSVHGFLFQGTR